MQANLIAGSFLIDDTIVTIFKIIDSGPKLDQQLRGGGGGGLGLAGVSKDT